MLWELDETGITVVAGSIVVVNGGSVCPIPDWRG